MTTTATARTERTSRPPAPAVAPTAAGFIATTTPPSPPAGSTMASATAAKGRTSTGAGLSSRTWIWDDSSSWDSTCRPARIIVKHQTNGRKTIRNGSMPGAEPPLDWLMERQIFRTITFIQIQCVTSHAVESCQKVVSLFVVCCFTRVFHDWCFSMFIVW